MKKQLSQNLEQWCSMQMIVDYLNISRETVLQWIDKKNMPAHKVGRQWRFKVSEVDDWIRSGAAAEKTESDTSDKEETE